jgi:hypothetical protein
MDKPDWIAILVWLRTGNAGNGHRNVSRAASDAAAGHASADLAANGGIGFNQRLRDAEGSYLVGLRVDNETAVERTRGAGRIR